MSVSRKTRRCRIATPERSLLFFWDDVELLPELQRVQFVLDNLPDAAIVDALSVGAGADGKAIRSHSTGRTLKGKRRTSDPDADRGVHAHRGVDRRTGKPWERVASWFGHKLHLVADTKHEIPVAFSVERASVSEQKVPLRDLEALFAEEPVLAKRRRFLSADRGYDQEKLKAWLWDAHRIRPPPAQAA